MYQLDMALDPAESVSTVSGYMPNMGDFSNLDGSITGARADKVSSFRILRYRSLRIASLMRCSVHGRVDLRLECRYIFTC